MALSLATALLYLSCVSFYHANKKHSTVHWIKNSPTYRRIGKLFAWCLLITSLLISASAMGWEQGIPVWLGLLTVAGIGSLLASALTPGYHITSGGLSAVIALTLAVGLMV